MTKGSKRKAQETPAAMEHGIHVDVLGKALIAEAGERIAWHKRSAAVLADELKSMTLPPGPPPGIKDGRSGPAGRTSSGSWPVTRSAPATWHSLLVTWSGGARTASV